MKERFMKTRIRDDSGQRLSGEEIKEVARIIASLRNEMGKVIAGQERILDVLISALLCNGHVLVEGVPGIAKTLIIKALAQVCGCSFKRIQFTVDLLPSDILGVTTYNPERGFEIVKGPIFVMANQNPIETEGVYNLPEAQIDRFIFKVLMSYPERNNESRIMEENV